MSIGLQNSIQQLEMKFHKLNDKIAAQQAEIDKLKRLIEENNANRN